MSTTPRLPELPPMRIRRHSTNSAIFDPTPDRCDCESPPKAYDADDLHAYGLAVWKAAIQHAADHCQERSRDWIGRGNTVNWEYRAHGAEDCAESLLSLPLPEQGSPQ